MDIKKHKKKKKEHLERVVASAQDILDKLFGLLDDAVSEYHKSNDNRQAIITAKILQEMADEMGEDHIDFMGMA